MGNLVGERFDDFVNNQINARQSLAGKGFGEASLSNSQLLLLNNRNAWLKLASSVNIVGDNTPSTFNTGSKEYEDSSISDGEQRLKDIGINNTAKYTGNQLSQKAVLFNTLSEVTPTTYTKNEAGELTDKIITSGSYNFRSGVSKTGDLWNSSNSYGLGGSNFGLTPAPGLISAKINCENRGSIRTAEVEIKAYNQFQFEMLELVYLRLGFTMMLEWGWDKYTTNGVDIKNVGNTLIEDHWFKDNSFSQLEMLNIIQSYRIIYAGNYDGFFGKVVNFDWSFNKNGTYDIKLKLITVGDVVESLKVNTVGEPLSSLNVKSQIESIESGSIERSRLEEVEGSIIVTNAGSSPLSQTLYQDIITPTLWDNKNTNFFSFNNVGNILKEKQDQSPQYIGDNFSYYMTFNTLLERIEKYCVPSIGENANKQINIKSVGDGYLCSAYPNQISFDPKICLIRPILTTEAEGKNGKSDGGVQKHAWYSQLKQFGYVEFDGKLLYGNIMNIYLNYNFISSILNQNLDEEGNISIYKFLTKICEGVNSSLGNLQQIEVVIRNDINVILQDRNSIPGLELKFPQLQSSLATPFELFGFNTTGSVSSNFVTDFNFNTKITPKSAAQISIGTTANNIETKNYDGTAFSKWNIGLKDRFASKYTEPDTEVLIPVSSAKAADVLTAEEINNEYNQWKNGEVDTHIGLDTVLNPFIRPRPDSLEAYGIDSNKEDFYYTRVQKSSKLGKSYGVGIFKDPLSWPQYIERVLTDVRIANAQQRAGNLTKKQVEEQFKNSYIYYLIRAFGGNLTNVTSGAAKIDESEALYYLMNSGFIKEGKSLFRQYIINKINNLNFVSHKTPGNTIGYIPIDLSLTLKGLSGIKLYQQLAIRQEFLPKQYPKALKFLITKTNHSISNNDWSTNLNTLGIPNVEIKENNNINYVLDNIENILNLDTSNALDTPNADRLRETFGTKENFGSGANGKDWYGQFDIIERYNTELAEAGDITKELADGGIKLFTQYFKGGMISAAANSIGLNPKNNNNKFYLNQIEITAGNDNEHNSPDSRSYHKFGNGLDFIFNDIGEPTLGNPITNYPSDFSIVSKRGKPLDNPVDRFPQIDIIDALLKKFTTENPNFYYINEYYYPSSKASGKHFHLEYRPPSRGN